MQNNTNRYGSYVTRCSKQPAAYIYRLLTIDQIIGPGVYICFDVTSQVLLSKEQEINKTTCNV